MTQMSPLAYSTSAIAGAPAERAYAESDMTISQMARLYGVSQRALRFYEDRGLINPRREGNARLYRATDRERLGAILQGKRFGFTLTEINELIGGKGASQTGDFGERLQPHQIAGQIDHLERQRDEIDNAIRLLRATRGQLPEAVM